MSFINYFTDFVNWVL